MQQEIMEMSLIITTCVFSFISFMISSVVLILFIAKDRSTHTIEYRNIDGTYDDEFNLDSLKGRKAKLDNDDYDEDAHSPEKIKDMNNFIEKNEVIL